MYMRGLRPKSGAKQPLSVRRLERRLNRLCGLPMTLKAVHVDKKDFDAVAKRP
ncbi:MAG: hypothetical protein ACLVJO_00870 [[Clostridium] scindens]